VAAAVGVQEELGRHLPAALTGVLGPKQLLLVLDHCEHPIEACAAGRWAHADGLRAGRR
jgi:predicted ATPase